jgi:hypothetical protein
MVVALACLGVGLSRGNHPAAIRVATRPPAAQLSVRLLAGHKRTALLESFRP